MAWRRHKLLVHRSRTHYLGILVLFPKCKPPNLTSNSTQHHILTPHTDYPTCPHHNNIIPHHSTTQLALRSAAHHNISHLSLLHSQSHLSSHTNTLYYTKPQHTKPYHNISHVSLKHSQTHLPTHKHTILYPTTAH